jgi:hypothetical protein
VAPAHDKHTVLAPAKVPPPPLLPRLEQTRSTPCHGIGSVGLIALEKVTRAARKPKIGLIICPAFGSWDDMFDFQRPGSVRLVRETITTTVRGDGAHVGV